MCFEKEHLMDVNTLLNWLSLAVCFACLTGSIERVIACMFEHLIVM